MLVLKHHLSPEYVLDKMEMYEIKALLNYEYYSKKDDWEQARLISYIIAQVNSKKKLKFDDITTFYWEKETTEKKDTEMTRENLERLKQQSQEYIKFKNKKNAKLSD